jgi:hypothetical protein
MDRRFQFYALETTKDGIVEKDTMQSTYKQSAISS